MGWEGIEQGLWRVCPKDEMIWRLYKSNVFKLGAPGGGVLAGSLGVVEKSMNRAL